MIGGSVLEVFPLPREQFDSGLGFAHQFIDFCGILLYVVDQYTGCEGWMVCKVLAAVPHHLNQFRGALVQIDERGSQRLHVESELG
jgi:hypothetical protein